LMRGLWSHESALKWRPTRSAAQWRWLLRWWQACGAPHAQHVRAMTALAHASLDRLEEISRTHSLEIERSHGVLMLMRHERDFLPTRRHVEMLREFGVRVEEVSAARARQIEPSLGGQQRLAGGVYLPEDGVGNCRQYAQQLRDICEKQFGVRFKFNLRVAELAPLGSLWRMKLLPTSASSPIDAKANVEPTQQDCNAVVLCTGAEGARLVPALARRVIVCPVQGYSISYRLRVDGQAPRSAVVDVGPGVVITRLGQRLRVSGGFALGDAPQTRIGGTTPSEAALAPLLRSLECWFPSAAERAHAQVWQGARAMLADGPPIIGPSPQPGLWLNLGHGAHGWTLACGAGQVLADLIDNKVAGGTGKPHIDPLPFSMAR